MLQIWGQVILDNVAKAVKPLAQQAQNSAMAFKVMCALCWQVNVMLMVISRPGVMRLCECVHHTETSLLQPNSDWQIERGLSDKASTRKIMY
jgi:hypothetical protein